MARANLGSNDGEMYLPSAGFEYSRKEHVRLRATLAVAQSVARFARVARMPDGAPWLQRGSRELALHRGASAALHARQQATSCRQALQLVSSRESLLRRREV